MAGSVSSAAIMNEDQQQTSHKWHAIECNNLAWALSEKSERTPTEDAEMLSAAHASAFHWAKVGTETNVARAQMLVAHVSAFLGHGDLAMAAAHECREKLASEDVPDWEAAFIEAIHAHAHYAAGEMERFSKIYAKAAELGAAIAGEEDRKIFEATFNGIPKP
ncbi:MAG: hypothetical protein CMJ86_00145 [Planctomycetes bacterium]|nr:hypothetical protein [Planctomycetota bacterium]